MFFHSLYWRLAMIERALLDLTHALPKMETRIMSGIADIKAALAELFAEIDKLEAAVASGDQAQIDEVVASIQAKKAEVDSKLPPAA